MAQYLGSWTRVLASSRMKICPLGDLGSEIYSKNKKNISGIIYKYIFREKRKEKRDTEIYASKQYASSFWKDQEYNFISIL